MSCASNNYSAESTKPAALVYGNLAWRFSLLRPASPKHNVWAVRLLSLPFLLVAFALPVWGQSKPTRSRPPEFDPAGFKGIFFEDVSKQLRGELPSERVERGTITRSGAESGSSEMAEDGEASDPVGWKLLVEPTVLEDLVKETKLRLEREITTPAAFASGGFQIARRDFSLLAALFAIIEHYPGEVRWKDSAAVMRSRLTRAAANTKVGSIQVYREAKQRLLDLDDLIRGSKIEGEAENTDFNWSNLIDRVPVMQLLEWAYDEQLKKMVASESEFNANKGAVKNYAELIAVLGRYLLFEDMPDATDKDYQQFSNQMIEFAQQVRQAVELDNPTQARESAGGIGQSCSLCHENFR